MNNNNDDDDDDNNNNNNNKTISKTINNTKETTTTAIEIIKYGNCVLKSLSKNSPSINIICDAKYKNITPKEHIQR